MQTDPIAVLGFIRCATAQALYYARMLLRRRWAEELMELDRAEKLPQVYDYDGSPP